MTEKRRSKHAPVALNKTALDALLKAEDRGFRPVEGLPGAYLRPAGKSVAAYVKYREGEGGRGAPERTLVVAHYPALTPPKLEAALRTALAAVELKQDPLAERRKARQTPTMAELVDRYFAEGCATKKASTIALDKIRLYGFVVPRLGPRKINTIEKANIDQLRDAIEAGKLKGAPLTDEERKQLAAHRRDPANPPLPPGRRVTGGRYAATRTIKLVKAVFNFAMEHKLLTENPAKGVKTHADRRRQRFTAPAEIGRLGEVLAEAEAKGANPNHIAMLRLFLSTGCRKNEIACLRWSEVHDGFLLIENHKTDSTAGPKVVHLGAAAQEILANVRRTDSPWVFPLAKDPSKPDAKAIDWFWRGNIRKAAGLDDVRIHDLRHSFASIGLAGGLSLPLLQKLLGHSDLRSTMRYAHLAESAEKAGADKISEAINAALKGGSGELKPIGKGG